jgi:Predicted transcriptional regulators
MDDEQKKMCPVEYTLSQISGKWRIMILKELSQGPVRYGELGRMLSGISAKILIQHLRGMEEDGLVVRTVYPEVPPRVEYSLSRAGVSVFSMLSTLRDWALASDGKGCVECRNCEKCVPRNYSFSE